MCRYAWSLIESGYYQYGIKIFWLDASEPEGFGPLATNASWSAGAMRDMGSMFTLYWTQVFYDGLQGHGESDIVMLPRAGWVGTWRHGAVLWSGDIGSTMEVLRSQVNIGISAQTSGIPWWTTDVGGYSGGHSQDPTYRETVGRWFQFGFTNPLLRQHGARDHTCPWYYGNETEKIIEDIIRLRHTMKPYFSAQLDLLNATGRPFNRPLMWDFPEDSMTWTLAERGIGDSSGGPPPPPPPGPAPLKNGDFVELVDCKAGSAEQQWTLDSSSKHLQLAGAANSKFCMDDGGDPGQQPPNGPYKVHMWTIDPKFSGAQGWSYDAATKELKSRNVCLDLGSNGHPTTASCSGATSQQWSFVNGGTITAGGKCLGVVPSSGNGPNPATGVIDQYMMGDDYMAAPIFNIGQRARMVYFPKGVDWTHFYTSTVYKGGTTAAVDAPLNSFPLFKRTPAYDHLAEAGPSDE